MNRNMHATTNQRGSVADRKRDLCIVEDQKIIRSDSYYTSDLDGELVMMSVEHGGYFSLNPMGSEIWKRIATPVTVAQLCDDLQKDFDVLPDQCRSEVFSFISQLSSKKLVTLV